MQRIATEQEAIAAFALAGGIHRLDYDDRVTGVVHGAAENITEALLPKRGAVLCEEAYLAAVAVAPQACDVGFGRTCRAECAEQEEGQYALFHAVFSDSTVCAAPRSSATRARTASVIPARSMPVMHSRLWGQTRFQQGEHARSRGQNFTPRS